jgi:hypothetical protein
MVLRLSCILLGLFVLAPDLVCAQGQSASGQGAPGQGAAVRKKGALWKGEVDDLVGVLTRAARAANALIDDKSATLRRAEVLLPAVP